LPKGDLAIFLISSPASKVMQGPQDTSRLRKKIFAKERPTEAPLPRALLLVTEEVRQKMKKLFDVAYMVAKLELLFTVDPSLCSLEKEHAVLLVEYSIHF